jgi:hypothetical protein
MSELDEQFESILEGRDALIQTIAREARALIYDVMPDTVEVISFKDQVARYGTPPGKDRDLFLYIALPKAHVNLGFYYGGHLSDADSLLEGEGKRMRHIKLRSVADARRPGVRALVEATVRDRTTL